MNCWKSWSTFEYLDMFRSYTFMPLLPDKLISLIYSICRLNLLLTCESTNLFLSIKSFILAVSFVKFRLYFSIDYWISSRRIADMSPVNSPLTPLSMNSRTTCRLP